MTRNLIRRSGLVLLSLLLPLSPLSADDEKDLRELLRDALYTEEVTRDPEAAAKQYEALLSQHDAQRSFAASALFRLAEVRRKQDRKDEAIALYQKLLVRFPEAEMEAKLARENLTTLGAKPAETKAPVRDYDQEEIERLRKLVASSPDMLRDALGEAVQGERVKVVEFLLSQGADPKTGNAWATAVQRGNLEICKLLLRQGKPSPEVVGGALAEAIRRDRMTILGYLLDQGFDANSPAQGEISSLPGTALFVAVEMGNLKAAAALLDHGADIDFMIPYGGDPVRESGSGTPLHLSTKVTNGLPMFRLLLERGAKPDLPTLNSGVTPLHEAVTVGTADSVEMVKELLARGADPNRRSTNQSRSWFVLVTPFELALQLDDRGLNLEAKEKIDAMLAKGANLSSHVPNGPNFLIKALRKKDRLRVKWLLEMKADPNFTDQEAVPPLMVALEAGESSSASRLLEAGADPNKPHGKLSPLGAAIQLDDDDRRWPLVDLLMAKGAKPDAAVFKQAVESKKWDAALKMLEAIPSLSRTPEGSPRVDSLAVAMQSADALPLIEKLIAMGVKPEEAWIEAGFKSGVYNTCPDMIPRPVRSFLFRRYLLPQMKGDSSVRIVFHGIGETKISVLDDPLPPLAPRSLAQALLDPTEPIVTFPKIVSADRVTIWRKDGESWAAASAFPLDSNEGFPVLQRGDVIEVTEAADYGRLRGDLTGNDVFDPGLLWSLSKRVSFPVTVEIDGSAKEVILRGDRLVFDPATPGVVPLAGARKVLQLLWQPEQGNFAGNGGSDSLEIVIRRDGWPDVHLPYNGLKKDFPLRAGDRIVFESPKRPDGSPVNRRGGIVVKCANGPFVRHFGVTGPHEGLLAPTIPTLFQALAEVTQVPGMKEEFADPVALHFWMCNGGWIPSYLQRADLSKIRIRRQQEGGSEKVMDIDLEKVIEETPEDASIDDVRKTDLELQDGDTVEIPVLPEEASKPWAGFGAKESNFLSKALSCRIQIDLAGNISVQEVRYHPPRIVATTGGLVPIPLSGKVSSLSGFVSLPRIHNTLNVANVTRGSAAGLDLTSLEVFLREGDRIVLPRSQRVPPR